MELSLNPLAFAYIYFFVVVAIFRQTRLVCLNLFNAIFLVFFFFFSFINGNSISRLIFTSYKRQEKKKKAIGTAFRWPPLCDKVYTKRGMEYSLGLLLFLLLLFLLDILPPETV